MYFYDHYPNPTKKKAMHEARLFFSVVE